MEFIAVAGRSSLGDTAQVASSLFSEERINWVYAEGVWEDWEVFGQPTVFLVTSDDILFTGWFGEQGETFLREQLDELVRVG